MIRTFKIITAILLLPLFAITLINQIPTSKTDAVIQLETETEKITKDPKKTEAAHIIGQIEVSDYDRDLLRDFIFAKDKKVEISEVLAENKKVLAQVKKAVSLGGAQYVHIESRIEDGLNIFNEKQAYSLYLANLMNNKNKKDFEDFESYLFETINSYSFNVQKLLHVSTLKVVREKIREIYPEMTFKKLDYGKVSQLSFLSEFVISKNMLRDLSEEQSFVKNIFYNSDGALNYYTKLNLVNKNSSCIKDIDSDCPDGSGSGYHVVNPIGRAMAWISQVQPSMYKKLKTKIEQANKI